MKRFGVVGWCGKLRLLLVMMGYGVKMIVLKGNERQKTKTFVLCLLWFVFVCMNDDYEGIAQRLQFREH